MYQSLGDYGRAREYHERSLEIQQEIGNRSGEATSWSALGMLARQQGKPEEALNCFHKAHQLFAALGERPHVQQSAENMATCLFQLALIALQNGNNPGTEKRMIRVLELSGDAGAQAMLSAFTNYLVVPGLQYSLELASPLIRLTRQVEKREEFADAESVLKAVEALLRFYDTDRSRTELDEVGPSEIFLIRALMDRIERPGLVRARELVEAKKITEAKEVLESLVEESPEDTDALLLLASVLSNMDELDEAERRLGVILDRRKDFPPALLLQAQLEQRRGRYDQAIKILQDLLNREPSNREIYPFLAQLLRHQGQFKELAALLRKWRDMADAVEERQRLDVWIPEAELLAGDFSRARIAMPDESAVPQDTSLRFSSNFLRVFLALHARDGGAARKYAVDILELAAELPPGDAPDPPGHELIERSRELLDERESKFFLGLVLAVTQRLDPIEFAGEFLKETEVAGLVQRINEEGKLAEEGVKSGKIQIFRDLLQTTTRSIGPAAGVKALGNAYGELAAEHKNVLLDVFTGALRDGQPGEATAALGAIGRNFPDFDSSHRHRALAAICDLATRVDGEAGSREQALRMINIFYPNLTEVERKDVRQSLEEIREKVDSPALTEFFDETVLQVESEENE